MRRRTGEALAAAALAALLSAAPRAAAEEVRVEASADRETLREDETLGLTIRIEGEDAPAAIALDEAALPFAVVDRAESRTSSFAFGKDGFRRGRTTVLRLTLAPRRTGELVVPPIAVTVKGARAETAAVRVTVLPAGGAPAAPAPPSVRSGGAWSGWERDLVLQVEVDRREAFLGEQVTATVWLLSPAGVVAYEKFRPPAWDGFWAEELETPRRLEFTIRKVNGVPTRAYLLQRLALFPTRSGAAELGPFELDVAVRVGSQSLLSPFGDVRRARRRSAPVALRVKPLPPGAPAGFEAVNVGSFRLEATASAPRVAVGEPVGVHVTATGDGNVRALALPRLPTLDGARRFEATGAEKVSATKGRLGGSRTLETVLVPTVPGALVVPPLAWPFFDPRSGRYAVARTRPLKVEVVAGVAPAAPRADPPPLAAALRPIRTGGALAPRAPAPWARAPFLAVALLPPLAFAGVALLDALRRRAEADAPRRRSRGAGRLARRRLQGARGRLLAGEREDFLAGVERALLGFAADRLGSPVAGMTRAALGDALAGAGIPLAGVVALAAALDACDAARFGGGAAPDAEVLARAEAALAALLGREGGGEPS